MNLRVVLIFIAVVNFIIPLGLVPLFDLDEGAFSEATREMLESGNYITTYLNGALRFDKPILIYWFQALSVKIFGLNEFALRLPSAIAGLLWAYAIWYFTKKELGEKTAFFATLFMISSLQINIIVKAAIADSLLNFFIALSLFAVWFYLDTNRKNYLYISFASIALGTLTKGPVAIMVPLLTLIIYLGIKGEFKKLFTTVFNPIGILIFLLIAAPWYILEYLEQGQKFIDGFFLKHNLSRFSAPMESHSGSIFYYIPVVLIGFLPFSSILFKSIFKLKRFLRYKLSQFLIIWFAFVFVFFSLSGTKLPHYVIYGYTPLFIIMALYIRKWIRELTFMDILPILILYVILIALPFLTQFIEVDNLYIKDILSNAKVYFNTKYIFYVSLAMLLTIIIKYLKINLKIKMALIGVIFSALINFVVVTAYANLVQTPLKEAALVAKKMDKNVIMYHLTKPSFLLYLEKKSLKEKPKSGSVVLLKSRYLKDFNNFNVLYSKNGIYLIQLK